MNQCRKSSIMMFLVFLLITLSTFGCASFPGKQLPSYTQEQIAKPISQIAVTYEVKAILLDRQSDTAADKVSKEISEILKANNISSQYTSMAKPEGYHLAFEFRNEGNAGLAFISGFISGFTFTLIPAYGRDNYILKADVKQGDRILKTYTYNDYMDSWIQLFLIFLTPTHWPGDVSKSVINNMIMNFANDFSKDFNSNALRVSASR